MTTEGLHAKSAIAAELAFRDQCYEHAVEEAEEEHDDQECCIAEQQKEIEWLRSEMRAASDLIHRGHVNDGLARLDAAMGGAVPEKAAVLEAVARIRQMSTEPR